MPSKKTKRSDQQARPQPLKFLAVSLSLALVLFICFKENSFIKNLHKISYDCLFQLEDRLKPPPPQIKDILLVVLDNQTLKNMTERWPYARSTFATVIHNLRKAGAQVIAFDFVFWGKTASPEDVILSQAVAEGKVILPCLINDQGSLDFSDLAGMNTSFYSGVITKIQDSDGVTRKNLTYIVNSEDPNKGMLSWEMQLLKNVKNIDLSTLQSDADTVSFSNLEGEHWKIPVDSKNKAFSIHFRAHAVDFNRLSFIHAFKNDFNPQTVKDKIIILGTLSSLFQDVHSTPIGWMPGVALNANAFLNLYTHDFLKNLPLWLELCVIFISVIVSTICIIYVDSKKVFGLILLQIFFLFLFMYALLQGGYMGSFLWMAILTLICPWAAKKIYDRILT